jgi:hypothetical protein
MSAYAGPGGWNDPDEVWKNVDLRLHLYVKMLMLSKEFMSKLFNVEKYTLISGVYKVTHQEN